MIDFRLTADDDILDALVDAIEAAPRQFRIELDRSLKNAEGTLIRKLKTRPGSPRYPLRWTPSRNPQDAGKKPNTRFGYYSRQKAAFFASDGFGRGIPSQPTNTLINAWQIIVEARRVDDIGILLSNTTPYAGFVQGENQQGFHADTGWAYFPKVVTEVQDELNDEIITAWGRALDLA